MAALTTRLRKMGQNRTARSLLLVELPNVVLISVGTALSSLAYVLFQVPHKISAGGITGVALIIDKYVPINLGLTFWLLSIPLLLLGFVFLGRWKFILKVGYGATLFAVLIDVYLAVLPGLIGAWPLSNDLLLSTVYGGVLGGIGSGLVFRAGGTGPGTEILARIIQMRTGMPLSQVYMFFDGAVLAVSGLVFGWEVVLYGLMMLFLYGLASDYILEGASTTRTVNVITDQPEKVAGALRSELQRNSSFWEIRGGYTGAAHYMVISTIARPQVQAVRRVVARTDPKAFVTIGNSTTAYGTGFVRLRKSADDV